MNNPWLPQKHRILNIIEETDLESTFVVEFRDPQIRHGQFFQLSLPRSSDFRIQLYRLHRGIYDSQSRHTDQCPV